MMTRRTSFVRRLSLLGAVSLAATAGAASAEGLDTLEPVVPNIGIGTAEPVIPHIGAGEVQPSRTGDAPKSVNPLSGVAIEQIIADTMSANEAWEKGALKTEDLLRLLTQPRLVDSPRSDEVRRDLAGVLSQRVPEAVKEPQKLDAFVRLALCHYWSSVGDERAVALCEGLVREKLTGKTKNASPWPWLWSLTYLAQYYEKTQQWEKAAQTWLRSEKPLAEDAHDTESAAGVVIEAARIYMKMGSVENEQKAKELYSRVSSYNNRFMTGLVLLDQARYLMTQGRHEEARQLLKTLTTEDDEVPVFLLSELAYSYYLTGDFEAARKAAEEASSRYKTLKELRLNVGLENQVRNAQVILDLIALRTTKPLVCAPSQLRVALSSAQFVKTITRHFSVLSARHIPLSITSDNSLVKARIVNDRPRTTNKDVVVEISPEARVGFRATLTIRSEKFPQKQVTVVILVEKAEVSAMSHRD